MLWSALLCGLYLVAGVLKADIARAQAVYRREDARCLPWVPCERGLDGEILMEKNQIESTDSSPSTVPEEAHILDDVTRSDLDDTDIDGNFTLVHLGGDPTFQPPSALHLSSRSDAEAPHETELDIRLTADNENQKAEDATATSTVATNENLTEVNVFFERSEESDKLQTRPQGRTMEAFSLDELNAQASSPYRPLHPKLPFPPISDNYTETYAKSYFDPLNGETEICECRRVRKLSHLLTVGVPEDEMIAISSTTRKPGSIITRRPKIPIRICTQNRIRVPCHPNPGKATVDSESIHNTIKQTSSTESERLRRPIHDQGKIQIIRSPPIYRPHSTEEIEVGHIRIRQPVQQEHIIHSKRTTPLPRFPVIPVIPDRGPTIHSDFDLIQNPKQVIVSKGGTHIPVLKPSQIHAGGSIIVTNSEKALKSEDELCILLKRMFATQLKKHESGTVTGEQIYKYLLPYRHIDGSYETHGRPIHHIGETIYHKRLPPAIGIDSDDLFELQQPRTHVRWQKKPESWPENVREDTVMKRIVGIDGGHAKGDADIFITKASVEDPETYHGPTRIGGGDKTLWRSVPKQSVYQESWTSGPYAIAVQRQRQSATVHEHPLNEEAVMESRQTKDDTGTTLAIKQEETDPTVISSEDMRLNEPGCGQLMTLRSQIVNREPAPEERFPWLINLRIVRGSQFICTASLITRRFLLTAAHCILQGGMFPSSIEAGYGSVNKKQAHYVTVSSFKLHPLYSRVPFEKHDIALLQLAHRLDRELARPICVSEQAIAAANGANFENVEKELATVAGWGDDKTTGGKSLAILRYGKVDIVPSAECVKFSKLAQVGFEKNLQICTLGNGTDNCLGDSGSPIMVLRGSKSGLTFPEGPMEQRGIVSFGFSCASPTPTVATRVDYYINWIRSSLQEWSSDPEVYTFEKPALSYEPSAVEVARKSPKQSDLTAERTR
ncbi:uncharacterized protein LOC111250398 isoform X2 [Varroa destructor]|uniref:Peptidase S1 domain-containing protein n=1 Tax=Varroa destructor TaxID=109461 RepID=A0A7M7KI51_VARDE|nr:uncharacterized protein LOC111250398 isoform X2 [Varroa destructor]